MFYIYGAIGWLNEKKNNPQLYFICYIKIQHRQNIWQIWVVKISSQKNRCHAHTLRYGVFLFFFLNIFFSFWLYVCGGIWSCNHRFQWRTEMWDFPWHYRQLWATYVDALNYWAISSAHRYQVFLNRTQKVKGQVTAPRRLLLSCMYLLDKGFIPRIH